MPAPSRSVTLLVVTFLLVALAACNRETKREEPPVRRVDNDTLKLTPDAVRNLKVFQAEVRDFPDRLSLMGRISVPEDRTVVVPARVGGRVDAVTVASGEHVTAGQQMATLFSSDFAVAREEYLQALKTRGSRADGGSDLVALSRRKLESLGLTAPDIAGLPHLSSAGGANMPVRAPRTGFVLDKKINIGTFVNIGDTLFTLGDIGKVWFAGDIYPEDLSKVHVKQEVIVEAADVGQPIRGTISFISPVVDPASRTIKVRALMDNPGFRLRADMYVKGNIILQKREALLIPTEALIRQQDGVYCFKQIGQGTFRRIGVRIAGEQDGMAAIDSGIEPHERVVGEGALLLQAALETTDQSKD